MIFKGRLGTPCEPLGEEEEGHCHNQVETPICGRRNTETEAKLTGFFLEILKQNQN